MPHVMVKLATGKSAEQKVRLTEAITRDVMTELGVGEEAVSLALEEIRPEDWTEKVYQPEIAGKWEMLTKKPGYDPLKK